MLSIIAVGFVTWMIFWMAKAARSMSGQLRSQVDRASDARPWSLVVVAMLAVGREGLETALFLWAATQAASRGAGTGTSPLLGAALGLLLAVGLGYGIYRGALKINLTRFFTWTGVFLILVAAGVLAYGVHDLQEAGVLPGLNNLAFDVSAAVPPTSWYGTLLKGIFNFSPATTVLEAAAWLLYAIPTMTLFLLRVRQRSSVPPQTPAPVSHLRGRPFVRLAHLPARKVAGAAACVLSAPLLAACTENSPQVSDQTDRGSVTVTATDTTCEVARQTAPSGRLQFVVTNGGSKINEFYLLAEDGLRIVGEVENIGPGLSRDLVLTAGPGKVLHGLQAGHGWRRYP